MNMMTVKVRRLKVEQQFKQLLQTVKKVRRPGMSQRSEIVKNSFFLSLIHNRIWRKKQHAIILHVGPPGTGKSYGALSMAEKLDKTFSIQRVVYDERSLFKLLHEGDSTGFLSPGKAVIFDEAAGSEYAADSRQSLSRTNKRLSFLATTFRARRLILFYISPVLQQIDKRLRTIGTFCILDFHSVDFQKKISVAGLQLVKTDSQSGQMFKPFPRVRKKSGKILIVNRISIDKPTPELCFDYEKKKQQFLSTSIERWFHKASEEIRDKEEKKDGLKELYQKALENFDDFLDDKGTIMRAAIRLKFGTSEANTRDLYNLLKRECEHRKAKEVNEPDIFDEVR